MTDINRRRNESAHILVLSSILPFIPPFSPSHFLRLLHSARCSDWSNILAGNLDRGLINETLVSNKYEAYLDAGCWKMIKNRKLKNWLISVRHNYKKRKWCLVSADGSLSIYAAKCQHNSNMRTYSPSRFRTHAMPSTREYERCQYTFTHRSPFFCKVK